MTGKPAYRTERHADTRGAVTPDRLKCLQELLDDAEDCTGLSEWEHGFLASMRGRVALDGAKLRLSEKQEGALKRIEAKVYAT